MIVCGIKILYKSAKSKLVCVALKQRRQLEIIPAFSELILSSIFITTPLFPRRVYL